MTTEINYPEGHPLHDFDDKEIARRAKHVSEFSCMEAAASDGNIHLMPASFAALIHELKRLKKELSDVMDDRNSIGLAIGLIPGDDPLGILDAAKKLRARVDQLEPHVETATDCISRTSRAIEEYNGLERQLDAIRELHRENYGEPMKLHLALTAELGVPEED